MKILLHMCCGPCSIYPIKILRRKGYDIVGRFFNPNIHPYREFIKRFETLEEYANIADIPLISEKNYGLISFLQKVVYKEKSRCEICYRIRLEDCAQTAVENKISFFSSTLFYSKYQNHSLMKKIAEEIAKKYQIDFVYHDFRDGWKEGIDLSIKNNMYRQSYCGCIYSEQERYDKSMRRKSNV